MMKKMLKKYCSIVCRILNTVVMVSVGTISLYGPYEYPMPAHLMPKDNE